MVFTELSGRYYNPDHNTIHEPLNKQRMQIQPICWEYIGEEQCLWLGKTTGMLSHIEIKVKAVNKDSDEYMVSTNIRNIIDFTATGIENTKIKAQDKLNSYSISLILT